MNKHGRMIGPRPYYRYGEWRERGQWIRCTCGQDLTAATPAEVLALHARHREQVQVR